MSMKLPTPEQLEQQIQEAEAEHDRVRETNRELQENFCPVSLGDWLNLCRRAEVPHVPATQVTEVLRDDYLAFDTEGEHRARMGQLWKTIQSARKDNQMMRLDCCTDEEVKYRMSRETAVDSSRRSGASYSVTCGASTWSTSIHGITFPSGSAPGQKPR